MASNQRLIFEKFSWFEKFSSNTVPCFTRRVVGIFPVEAPATLQICNTHGCGRYKNPNFIAYNGASSIGCPCTEIINLFQVWNITVVENEPTAWVGGDSYLVVPTHSYLFAILIAPKYLDRWVLSACAEQLSSKNAVVRVGWVTLICPSPAGTIVDDCP